MMNDQHVSALSYSPLTERENKVVNERNGTTRHMDFSLFYFASADDGNFLINTGYSSRVQSSPIHMALQPYGLPNAISMNSEACIPTLQ